MYLSTCRLFNTNIDITIYYNLPGETYKPENHQNLPYLGVQVCGPTFGFFSKSSSHVEHKKKPQNILFQNYMLRSNK